MSAALPQLIRDYLAAHNVMTLATVGGDGPWASAVFYAMDGNALVFLSSPASRHGSNLAFDARCAATIQDDVGDWAHVKGIQMEGRVMRLAGAEAERARERYGEKFPVVNAGAGVPAAIADALSRVSWYRLVPRRVCFVDNSRGFGHRDEITLS